MPITDKTCPDCDKVLHTDDLLGEECTACGHKFTRSFYDDVVSFYTPERFQ